MLERCLPRNSSSPDLEYCKKQSYGTQTPASPRPPLRSSSHLLFLEQDPLPVWMLIVPGGGLFAVKVEERLGIGSSLEGFVVLCDLHFEIYTVIVC